MTTFAKYSTGAALAAVLTLPFATPVAAGEKSQDLVVRPATAAMDAWQTETTRDLNRALMSKTHSGKLPVRNGIVQVSFTLGEDGRAENIKLYNSTSNFWGERLAKRAVRKLDNLDEVPIQHDGEVKFLANLVFANSVQMQKTLLAKLERAETTRLASAAPSSQYIVLGM